VADLDVVLERNVLDFDSESRKKIPIISAQISRNYTGYATHSESHLPKSLMPWVSVTRGTSLGNIVAILEVSGTPPGSLDDRSTPEAGLFRKRGSRVLGLSEQSLDQTN